MTLPDTVQHAFVLEVVGYTTIKRLLSTRYWYYSQYSVGHCSAYAHAPYLATASQRTSPPKCPAVSPSAAYSASSGRLVARRSEVEVRRHQRQLQWSQWYNVVNCLAKATCIPAFDRLRSQLVRFLNTHHYYWHAVPVPKFFSQSCSLYIVF